MLHGQARMQLFTHPRSEELEENGLSVGGSLEVFRGELHSRSGGCRKGKEEGGLFHHGVVIVVVGFVLCGRAWLAGVEDFFLDLAFIRDWKILFLWLSAR